MLDWLGSLPVTDIALALICGGVAWRIVCVMGGERCD